MLFGVFDGHGGGSVSQFVKQKFVEELKACQQFKDKDYAGALEFTFYKMDELMLSETGQRLLEQIYVKQPKEKPLDLANMTKDRQ